VVVVRGSPEEVQCAIASTVSLPDVNVEAKVKSEFKRVSLAARSEIAEPKLGIGSL